MFRVRVHYPNTDGRLVLRAEPDWERDLEPVGVNAARTRWDFEIPTESPFAYFKPVFVRDGERTWSQGDNYLALPEPPEGTDVYPYFFHDPHCIADDVDESGCRERFDHLFRVFVPPGYRENTLKRYPVLYMQDGQNVFFAEEAFAGHHWRIPETLNLLESMNAIDKVLVVGVYPKARETEYTAPGYEAYGRFLVEKLKPEIDATYRTLEGPTNNAVMGSSLGGVVSFYLAWQWPGVFGKAACLSSTFGWRDDLLDRVRREAPRPVQLYLDSGWPRDNYEVTRVMRDLLVRRGYRQGVDVEYVTFPGARHNEDAWAMRAHIPFQFFFGRRRERKPARRMGERES
jgi:predicted alpha/beta superfamily hydrolase